MPQKELLQRLVTYELPLRLLTLIVYTQAQRVDKLLNQEILGLSEKVLHEGQLPLFNQP